MTSSRITKSAGPILVSLIVLVGGGMVLSTAFGAGSSSTVSTSVVVDNATPSIANVVLNAGNPIVLTANATTAINVSFDVTDQNGCGDVFTGGLTTSTAFRSAVTFTCTASNLSCYRVTTTTNNCSSGATANATATVEIYYFADATDSSSSFSGENWGAVIEVQDAAGVKASGTATNVELNTLTAINVTTSSINYATVPAGTDTGSTNQTATTTNAGNSSTTLRLQALATLTSGANSIATSSQHYATSSFTFGGAEQSLSDTAATVSGFLLTSPTSTSNVAKATFWGLTVPGGTATGTYSGTTAYISLFQP